MLHERSIISACRMRWHSSAVRASYHHLLAGDGSCRPGDSISLADFAMGISGLGHMINSAGDFGPCCLVPVNVCCCRLVCITFWCINSLYRRRRHAGSLRSNRQGALTIFQAQLSCPTTHGFSEAPRVSFRKVKCLRFSAVCQGSVSYVSLRAPGKSP